MAKASDAFRTISEVSESLSVPKHVLRFWEAKFPSIKPMKRGGGRRFYRPEDLELLRGIRHLLHQAAYTIKGVQKILREQGPDAVKAFGRDAVGRTPRGASSPGEPLAVKPAVSKGVTAQAVARSGALTDAHRRIITMAINELEACMAVIGRPYRRSSPGVAARRAS